VCVRARMQCILWQPGQHQLVTIDKRHDKVISVIFHIETYRSFIRIARLSLTEERKVRALVVA